MWRVGIIGAGSIAQGFDQPGDSRVLSMAHAFKRVSGFAVGGFYDIDPRRAEAAERKWGVPASPRHRAEWLNSGWDVVYIATPDAQHAADLRDALAYRPKAILAEKPLTLDGAEGLNLLQEAWQNGVLVMVDYPRRWHSATMNVAEASRTGKIGAPISAVCTVSGGIAHNAPHMFDLMHTWWGGGWQVSLEGRHGNVTLLAFSREGKTFTAIVIDWPAQLYSLWEAHFYCAQGKLEISHSPETLQVFDLQPHPDYSSFRVLTSLVRADMEDEPLLCRVVEALAEAMLNPTRAEDAWRREVESQMLIAEVLRHF